VSETASWPPLDPGRLGDAVDALAERVAEPDVRAQLHALAGLVRNLVEPTDAARAGLARALAQALESGDEAAFLAATRALARADRERVTPVDWRAASGG
jgi:hypothetical protein